MFDYYDVAEKLGQPSNDAFYDSFYDDKTKFVFIDKYIYPKNISPVQAIELEDKLDDWSNQSNKIFIEDLSNGEPLVVNSLLEWESEKDNVEGTIFCFGNVAESLLDEFDDILDGYDVEVLDEPKQTKKRLEERRTPATLIINSLI